uniref:Uncharacterized protein n=1 Tax=Romanomermis culicivorax TaxID=13658 RepID=A0A915KX03_ROMCU
MYLTGFFNDESLISVKSTATASESSEESLTFSLLHRIFNASNYMHHQLPVTIPLNEPQSKKALSADNPTDLFDHLPSHPEMIKYHGHAAQPSLPTTAIFRQQENGTAAWESQKMTSSGARMLDDLSDQKSKNRHNVGICNRVHIGTYTGRKDAALPAQVPFPARARSLKAPFFKGLKTQNFFGASRRVNEYNINYFYLPRTTRANCIQT